MENVEGINTFYYICSRVLRASAMLYCLRVSKTSVMLYLFARVEIFGHVIFVREC
eukprot:UN05991